MFEPIRLPAINWTNHFTRATSVTNGESLVRVAKQDVPVNATRASTEGILVDPTEWTIFDTISWTIVGILFLLIFVLIIYLTFASDCCKRKSTCECHSSPLTTSHRSKSLILAEEESELKTHQYNPLSSNESDSSPNDSPYTPYQPDSTQAYHNATPYQFPYEYPHDQDYSQEYPEKYQQDESPRDYKHSKHPKKYFRHCVEEYMQKYPRECPRDCPRDCVREFPRGCPRNYHRPHQICPLHRRSPRNQRGRQRNPPRCIRPCPHRPPLQNFRGHNQTYSSPRKKNQSSYSAHMGYQQPGGFNQSINNNHHALTRHSTYMVPPAPRPIIQENGRPSMQNGTVEYPDARQPFNPLSRTIDIHQKIAIPMNNLENSN